MFYRKKINEISYSICCFFFTCGILLFPDKAHSNEEFEVLWGGLGFSSYGENSASPVAEILRNCNNIKNPLCLKGDIHNEAANRFFNVEFNRIDLKNNQKIYANQRGYLLSPVITTEIVLEADQGSSGISYTYIIVGNVLTYEIESNDQTHYIYSLPVALLIDEYYDKEISKEEQQNYIADMYLNDNRDAGNIFTLMAEISSKKAHIPLDVESKAVKISSVEFSQEVEDILFQTGNMERWKSTIANFTEARLASWTGKPIIPYTLGKNQLRFVFIDGFRTIKLPIALYEFEIDVKRFVKQEPEQGVVCFMVATVFSVRVFDELYLNAPFFHTQDGCIDIPKGVTRESAVFFPMNLLSQLDSFTKMFSGTGASVYVNKSVKENRPKVIGQIDRIYKEAFGG